MQADWAIWAGVLCALLLSGAGVAAWLFPGWWQAGARSALRGTSGAAWTAGARETSARLGGTAAPRRWLAKIRLGRQGGWWLIGLALVLLPAALVMAWSHWRPHRLNGFDETATPANTQVAQLLVGEHLVPPPPLPPEVFLAADIVAEQPLLASADRRWGQMDPGFVQAVLQVFQVMKVRHGYDMALLEGWRSPQRQAMLATRGPSVTQAGPWQSYHQWGLAADCAFMREGRLVISERDPWARQGYALFGQVAEQMGLTWGGRWQMADLGHIEWRKPGMQATMQSAARAALAPSAR